MVKVLLTIAIGLMVIGFIIGVSTGMALSLIIKDNK